MITIILLNCLLLSCIGVAEARALTAKQGNLVTTAHTHATTVAIVADVAEEVDDVDPTCPEGTEIPWTNDLVPDVKSDAVLYAKPEELRVTTDDVYLSIRRLLI